MKKTKAKTKTYTPFYKDWTFIILSGILILMLICYIYRSVKHYVLAKDAYMLRGNIIQHN